jgi:hypothetical protein
MLPPKLQRIALSVVGLGLLAITPSCFADSSEITVEFRVKAVVLFNFAKYVHWPATVFQSPSQRIEVCLVGKSPFGDLFSRPTAPREAQNRPFRVVKLDEGRIAEESIGCQILFWQEADEPLVVPLLPALAAHSVLTVANHDSEHAMIGFLLKGEKVRFRIHRKAAEEAGLEFSSQLLKLADLDD